jgi:steroid 5-alpha reductase family enzyme
MPPTLLPAALVCLGVIAACWLLSVVTREYSWVDRIWSVIPLVYVWMFAAEAGWAPRSVGIAVLVTLWGARLTFNFWRKGGYAPGGEDYRWKVLREKMPGWAYQVFNLTFIAAYQNVLLFLISLPAWVVVAHPAPLGPLDLVAGLLFLGALVGETVSDQQQWRFYLARGRGETTLPFNDTGVWAWSRHPNFFFEQSQWWILMLFPLAAGAGAVHLGVLGAPLLTLLFLGSTQFTEQISLSKYPAYAAYQKRTSMLVPWPPRG